MLELNKIYCMDCLDGLKLIPDNSIDLVVADFPYNISQCSNAITKVGADFQKADFGEWDKFTFQEYCKWVIEVAKEINRILKPKHQTYCWFDNSYTGLYNKLIEDETDLKIKCPIVCYKRNPIPQIFKKNFRSSFDMCTLFVKDKDKKCEIFNFLEQSEMKNVQEFNLCKLTDHPTEKNFELVKRFIKISSNEGDTVLDPFMGSGTTAVACKQLRRNFIGFELSQKYVDIANKRLQQDTLFNYNVLETEAE